MLHSNNGADNARREVGRNEGRRRKDFALSALESRREWFVTQGRRILLTELLSKGTASADDVRERLALPPDIGPVCLGSVPRPFAQSGMIRRSGYITTSRPEAHARPVTRWELVDTAAARQWLADHPAGLVDDSPMIAGIESLNGSPVVSAPIENLAELGCPGELPPARLQRSLFNADIVEGLNNV